MEKSPIRFNKKMSIDNYKMLLEKISSSNSSILIPRKIIETDLDFVSILEEMEEYTQEYTDDDIIFNYLINTNDIQSKLWEKIKSNILKNMEEIKKEILLPLEIEIRKEDNNHLKNYLNNFLNDDNIISTCNTLYETFGLFSDFIYGIYDNKINLSSSDLYFFSVYFLIY